MSSDFVKQSTFHERKAAEADGGLHVAVIMDGNGRWARRRGLPRGAGHREGAKAVRAVVERAADPSSGIGTLTLYAFSSDNWGRPREEVIRILRLLDEYLGRERTRCAENGVRLTVVGRRDRLSPRLVRSIERAEDATRDGDGLRLRLAVDYSAREVLARAAELWSARAGGGGVGDGGSPRGGDPPDRDRFRELLAAAMHDPEPAPDVDLLVRTGGERRLSDFLLWESAYAELYFTASLWPDFGGPELDEALAEFGRRERRFGGLGASHRDLEAAV